MLKKNEAYKILFYFLPAKLLLILCIMFTGPIAFAQLGTTIKMLATDSAKNYHVDSLKKLGSAVAKKNMEEFRGERIATKQDELIESLKKTVETTKDDLKTGIDTIGLNASLARVENWYSIAGDGVFKKIGPH